MLAIAEVNTNQNNNSMYTISNLNSLKYNKVKCFLVR